MTKEELRSLEGEMEKDVDSSQDNQEKEKVEKNSSLSISLDLESLRYCLMISVILKWCMTQILLGSL